MTLPVLFLVHLGLFLASRRYLIAQDRHEIFVIKSEYDQKYIGTSAIRKEQDVFMEMAEYGHIRPAIPVTYRSS